MRIENKIYFKHRIKIYFELGQKEKQIFLSLEIKDGRKKTNTFFSQLLGAGMVRLRCYLEASWQS